MAVCKEKHLLIFIIFPSLILQARSMKAAVFTTEFPTALMFSNSTGARLPCLASGDPKPTISWTTLGGSLVNNVTGLRQVMVDNTVIFPPFRAEDYRQDIHAVVYRCLASNDLGIVVSTDVQVRAVVNQPFDVHVYDTYAIRGSTAVVRCNIPDFMKELVFVTTWIRDSIVSITASRFDAYSKYLIFPSGDLHIRNVTLKDGMTRLRCQVRHRLTGEEKTSVTAGRLIITEATQKIAPKLTKTRSDVSIKENGVAVLPCVAQGFPFPHFRMCWIKEISTDSSKKAEMNTYSLDPTQYSREIKDSPDQCIGKEWSKQTASGHVIPLTVTKRVTSFVDGLMIEDVQFSDAGMYICTASNDAGSDESAIHLTVEVPLKITVTPIHESVPLHSTVTLNCKISGSPVNRIIWLKDGQQLPIDGIQQPNNETLYISSMKTSLKGVYQCIVTNAYQSVSAIGIIELGDFPPEIIKGFESKVLQPEGEIVLECVAKGIPLPTIQWMLDEIQVSEFRGNFRTEVVPETQQVVSRLLISNVRTEDGGLYRCTATNRVGKAYYHARINVYGKVGIRRGSKIFATNGQTVLINCPVYGYPLDQIRWERNGASLPQNDGQIPFRNGTLAINDIQRRVDEGKYTCIIKTGKDILKGEVEVVVMVSPKISPFSFQDEQIREGTRARIQCVVSEGEAPLKLTWLKDGRPIPSELNVNIRDLDEFSSILMISAITPRHNGNYTCVASNVAGQARHTAPLFVNVSPRITPFGFRPDLFEGNVARVTCVVDQGDLPLTLHWIKDGVPVSSIGDVAYRTIDEYSSILTIENVKLHHSGNYTCIARNTAASATHSATLIVHVPPKIVPFTFQDEHLLEGMLVRVSCVVSRGDLPLSISWLKDGRLISPSEMSITIRDFDEYSSVLSIDPVTSAHSGNYSCVARNHAGTSKYSTYLVVNVPPRWTMIPEDVTVRNGKRLMINCQADGFPLPQITWKKLLGNEFTKENKISIYNDATNQVFPNGSLLFYHIGKNDEGYYFCIVNNDVGKPISKAISIKVQAAPIFKENYQEIVVNKSEEARIICSADGDWPMTFTWSFSNRTIDTSLINHRYTINPIYNLDHKQTNGSELVISHVDRKDSSIYRCKAKNSIGENELFIKLIVEEPPEAPTLHFIPPVVNQTVRLHWTTPFDGNSAILYHFIQYKKESERWTSKTQVVVVAANGTNAYVISGLKPWTTYQFRMFAENRAGNGSFSDVVTVKTDESAPSGPPQFVDVESLDTNTFRVTWKPPKKPTWNGPIEGYRIGYKIDNSTDDYTFGRLEVPDDYTDNLIYQLNNLKMFTQYNVIVQAYNSKGSGPTSEPVLAMTSEDVPSKAPEGIRCSALSTKSIYVLWEPPSADSIHGIIRGYKVLYKPAEEWYDSQLQSKTTDSTKITLQGLQVNTNYSIKVVAFTKIGDGVKSQPIFCKTHEDVPDPPVAVKVLRSSSESVVLSWKPSDRNKGNVIKYNVYFKALDSVKETELKSDGVDNYLQEATILSTKAEATYLEITKLKKNRYYLFWVSAVSMIGESPRSSIVSQRVVDDPVGAKTTSFDSIVKIPWNRDILLPCRAVGIPSPERNWFYENEMFLERERASFRPDGTLMIAKATKEDSGNYTCKVYNKFGNDEVKYEIIVQIPPNPPVIHILSKTTSSIKLQWKPQDNKRMKVRGYFLHYKRDSEEWLTKEIRAEYGIYSLEGLVCGATYTLYMETFNVIGVGPPSEYVTVELDGSNAEPLTKEALIRDGVTFITLNLDEWPSGGCPVLSFRVEYKPMTGKEWTVVAKDVPPTQKKLVVSGLAPATWYLMRMHVKTHGGTTMHEYRFSTLTSTGGTISPEVIADLNPVYVFHMDPFIFIPATALLLVVIVASIIVCVCFKRKGRSFGAPSEFSETLSRMSTWSRRSRCRVGDKYDLSRKSATLPCRKNKDPSPYAMAHVSECYPELSKERTLHQRRNSASPWKNQKSGRNSMTTFYDPSTMSCPPPPPPLSALRNDSLHQSMQENTFVFPAEINHP